MKILLFRLAAAGILLAPLDVSATERAVSEANGLAAVTFAAAGASGESARALLVGGQYTMPLSDSWGSRFALNAGLAFGSGTDAAEAASGSLAAFWRQPETGFVEFRAYGSHFSSVDLYGGEITAGRFLDDWDFALGVGFLETPNGSAATGGIGFGRYPTENLRWHIGIDGGATFHGGATYGGEFGVQWQPSSLNRNLVFGIEAGGGAVENEAFYQGGIFAVLYFGESRTLRQKIREDW